jgi:hypothetical protein
MLLSNGRPVQAPLCDSSEQLRNVLPIAYVPSAPPQAAHVDSMNDLLNTPLLWGLDPFITCLKGQGREPPQPTTATLGTPRVCAPASVTGQACSDDPAHIWPAA